jgi:hypothetical protein
MPVVNDLLKKYDRIILCAIFWWKELRSGRGSTRGLDSAGGKVSTTNGLGVLRVQHYSVSCATFCLFSLFCTDLSFNLLELVCSDRKAKFFCGHLHNR